jgi:hypothetical protein
MSTQPHVEIDLETQIDWQFLQLSTAKTPEDRRIALGRMEALIKLRTPERVEEMERGQGLRR